MFYTDGLTEVFRGDEEFGPERLLDEFSKCPSQKADGILDALWAAIEEFSAGGPQGDDMTALALCRWSECRGDAGMSERKTTNVEVRLPSRMGFEKVAMSTAASVAKLMGFRDDRIEDLKTAVAEACINAIEHGNRLNEKLSVGVVLSAGEDSLEVKVIDDGKGMKTQPAKPDIDRKMHGEEDPRGMGMFLIQALVDEAEWVAGSNGRSSYVRLVIRLDKDAE